MRHRLLLLLLLHLLQKKGRLLKPSVARNGIHFMWDPAFNTLTGRSRSRRFAFEVQADPELYASNVRAFMLEKQKELEQLGREQPFGGCLFCAESGKNPFQALF